jgi:hypothetical protein
LIRQRYDSYLFRNFIKWEHSTFTKTPIDERDPNMGGKITITTKEFNFSMMKLFVFNQFGYYTNDKLVFGKFKKE